MNLTFSITGVRAEKHAAVPTLVFRLRIEAAGSAVHAMLLRAQIQIEPRRRSYSEVERERLLALFGEPERWRETLRPLILANVSFNVPGFAEAAEIDLPVACTYDFEVASAKYLHAIENGDIPLLFLFSGTIFAKNGNGYQVEQVPWDREASYRMPARLWRELMDAYFPGCGWVRLRRESLDALERFKAEHALPTWEDAIEALIEASKEPAQ